MHLYRTNHCYVQGESKNPMNRAININNLCHQDMEKAKSLKKRFTIPSHRAINKQNPINKVEERPTVMPYLKAQRVIYSFFNKQKWQG